MKLTYHAHAVERMAGRGISQDQVENALNNPDEAYENEIGFVVHKIITDDINNKKYLLRIFYERTDNEIEVISVYKTSKIKKYWKGARNED